MKPLSDSLPNTGLDRLTDCPIVSSYKRRGGRKFVITIFSYSLPEQGFITTPFLMVF